VSCYVQVDWNLSFANSHASLNEGETCEKCVVGRFRCCAIVIECTYTNLDSIAYYIPRLYGIAYCSLAINLYSMLLY